MGETSRPLKEHYENPALQEKGNEVLRELTRVINTFNTALKCKEKQRVVLIGKINELNELIGENFKKLKTLTRNIEIYNQNTQKISVTLENFSQRETLIKGQFELLLQGSANEEISRASKDVSTSVTRESLIKRRKEYLDGLDNVFKQLEGELSTIENIRKEMEHARVEISIKREETQETKEQFENNNSQRLGEVKALEAELGNSVKEEQKLIKEFGKMTSELERVIELNPEIDHILFSILSASESSEKTATHPNGREGGSNGSGSA